MRTWRVALTAAGLSLTAYGLFRLVTEIRLSSLAALMVWLIAAVLIHDGLLSPLVLAVGSVLTRLPARARRYVQIALLVGLPSTVIAIPLILRRGSQPASKAILQQNYGGHLGLLWAGIAAATLLGYAVRVARDRPRPQLPAGPHQALQDEGESDLRDQATPPPPRRQHGNAEQ
jgi:hypothetical protein